MSNHGIRELKRKREKKRKEKIKKRILGSLALVFVVGTYLYFNADNDSDSLIDQTIDKRVAQAGITESISQNSNVSIEELNKATSRGYEDLAIPDDLKLIDDSYSDNLKSYIIPVTDSNCYSKPDENTAVKDTIPKGEYVEYYGSENSYAKVKYDDTFYYVNSNGLEKYEDENSLKVINGILYVNDKYSLPKNFSPSVSKTAQDALTAMSEDMEREDLHIKVESDMRSYDLEGKLKDANNPDADDPGHSEHQTGLAFDLYSTSSNKYSEKFEDSPEYKWLKENASLYGFIERYPKGKEEITGHKAEPWHFRFVGVNNSKIMYENNLTLEEYLKLK